MYEENFYENYTELDEQVEAFKQSILSGVKKDITDELESLRKENAELSVIRDTIGSYKKEQEDIIRKTKYEREDLERQMKHKRLSEIFEELKIITYRADTRKVNKPKCDKCDNYRKISFTSPSGKVMHEDCTCGEKDYIFVPCEMVAYEFRCRDRNNNDIAVHYKRSESERGDSEYYQESTTYCETRYAGQDYSTFKNTYTVFFSTEEECQKYCDYLNKEKGLPVNCPLKPLKSNN